MPEQRVNAVNFDVCKTLSKIIGYHIAMSVGLLQNFCQHNDPRTHIHVYTNAKILVKIDPVFAEILSGKCQFLFSFYRATAMLSAVYAVVVCYVCVSVCLCVCLSVCHTPVLYQNG